MKRSAAVIIVSVVTLFLYFGAFTSALVYEESSRKVINSSLRVAHYTSCTTHINGVELDDPKCENIPVYWDEHYRVTHQGDLLW